MTLNDLFTLKLQALYDIESELIDALPVMAKNATDMELKNAFEEHLSETRMHAERIKEIFSIMDIQAKKTKVKAIRGIISDAEWLTKNISGATALDAALISAAQYAEYYEMAGYASAAEWARILGYGTAAKLLLHTLDEEKHASDTLLQLSLAKINREALSEEENTEESGVM